MAQRAFKFTKLPDIVAAGGTVDQKSWSEELTDGANTVEVPHVTLSPDLVLVDHVALTATGSQAVYVGAMDEINVLTTVDGTVSGTTPSMTVSVQDLSPGDLTTVLDQAISGAPITATGAKQPLTHWSNSGWVLVKWTITGTTPNFGGTYITVSGKVSGGTPQPRTGAKSNVTAASSSTTLLAANSERKRWSVWNDSTSNLYVDMTGGTAAATSASFKLVPGQFYEDSAPVPGLITAISDASPTGTWRVCEYV